MSSKFRGGFFKLCGIKVLKKRKKKTEITRKSTNSSTHTSSQNTSESLLNRYSSNRTNPRDSLRQISEPSCSYTRDTKCTAVKESYVRVPLQIINGISGQKMPTEEIYV